jgi:hypothetical protein
MYSHQHTHGHADSDGIAYQHSHEHSHGDVDGYTFEHADEHFDAYGHADRYGHGNGYSHGDSDRDNYAIGYSDGGSRYTYLYADDRGNQHCNGRGDCNIHLDLHFYPNISKAKDTDRDRHGDYGHVCDRDPFDASNAAHFDPDRCSSAGTS